MDANLNPNDFSALYVRHGFNRWAEVRELVEKFKGVGKRIVDANLVFEDMSLGKVDALNKLFSVGVNVPKFSMLNEAVLSGYKFPIILKSNFGFGGKGLQKVLDLSELKNFQYQNNEKLIQEYISDAAEYKVITIGFKSLPVIIRIGDGRAKILSTGEKPELVLLAEKAAKILGRELAKVDILEKDGQLFVLEVNRWPGFQMFEKTTGYNVAGEFVKYLNGKGNY